MPARRCSTCSIDYPGSAEFGKCQVCGGHTSWFSNLDWDKNWKTEVERALKGTPEKVDPVYSWRYSRLELAGYPREEALILAQDRRVDLHKAVVLAERAGVDMALKILT